MRLQRRAAAGCMVEVMHLHHRALARVERHRRAGERAAGFGLGAEARLHRRALGQLLRQLDRLQW
jgi:hypothetical protein